MLLLPTNVSEVLILYLLYQEAGKKYGSKKTFANIESHIYLKMSREEVSGTSVLKQNVFK